MPTEAQSTSSEELSGQRAVVTGGSGFNFRAWSWGWEPSVSLEQGLAEVTGEWGGARWRRRR